jgi:hypothetical protein
MKSKEVKNNKSQFNNQKAKIKNKNRRTGKIISRNKRNKSHQKIKVRKATE